MSFKTSLLWKLSLPETELVSYLFGTMHIRDQRAFGGLERVYECIGACGAFALEIDLDQEESPGDPALFKLPGNGFLREHLSANAYMRLRRSLLKAFGVDIRFFPHLNPFTLLELISGKVLAEDNPLFLDAHLWNYARGQGKTTFGIETLQEQMALLSRIPLEVQLKMLRDMGRNTAHFRTTMHRMARVYEKGDLITLYRLSRKSAGNMRKQMLFDRNRIMAERIAALLPGESVFCAVGAAHLWGGKGVLRLLKHRGVHVDPVHFGEKS